MKTIQASPQVEGKSLSKRIVLSVRELTVAFPGRSGELVAVDNVSFNVGSGEILGIVGESGSGKSITLRAIMGIIRPRGRVRGEILWRGHDLVARSERELRGIRGREIAMIFQEPTASLNPMLTVGRQIEENLAAHTTLDRGSRRRRCVELLDMVGIPDAARRLDDYPHEFSGGMRQRAMIAIALASSPQLLLADEPTTALDVTIQDQILRLLGELCQNLGMAMILVTHDMGVVAETCDRVAVMYGGRFAEVGPTRSVIASPHHPYTRGLLKSIPQDVSPRTQLFSIPGTPPSIDMLPQGCAFAERCRYATENCVASRPLLYAVGARHAAACHNLSLVGEGGIHDE